MQAFLSCVVMVPPLNCSLPSGWCDTTVHCLREGTSSSGWMFDCNKGRCQPSDKGKSFTPHPCTLCMCTCGTNMITSYVTCMNNELKCMKLNCQKLKSCTVTSYPDIPQLCCYGATSELFFTSRMVRHHCTSPAKRDIFQWLNVWLQQRQMSTIRRRYISHCVCIIAVSNTTYVTYQVHCFRGDTINGAYV